MPWYPRIHVTIHHSLGCLVPTQRSCPSFVMKPSNIMSTLRDEHSVPWTHHRSRTVPVLRGVELVPRDASEQLRARDDLDEEWQLFGLLSNVAL